MLYVQQSLIDPLVKYAFILMLVVGVILPSDGNHSLFAPKSLAFLNAFFFFALYFFSCRRLLFSQAKAVALVLVALTFFSIWYVVGIDQNPLVTSGQFDQFKVFMTTLFVPIATYFLVKDKIILPETIIKAILYANAFYCGIKVLLMILHVLGIVNAWTVMHLTGVRYMSMHIMGEIGRIQTSVDIATPYLVYFALQEASSNLKLSKTFKWFYVFVAAVSVFLSFSRLLIFGYLLSIMLYGVTLKLKPQIKFWVGVAVFTIFIFFAIGPEKVGAIIEKRLFSSDNTQSDATRHVQIEALMQGCDENPIIGKGMGGYTTECIRDYSLPHAYEVQWIAFLMQFGVLGLLILLMPISFIAWKLVIPPISRIKLGYFLLFGLWLVSGFTNPFLISLTSGIMYMLFLLVDETSKKTC